MDDNSSENPQIDQRRRTEIASQMRVFHQLLFRRFMATDESILKDPKLNAVVNIFPGSWKLPGKDKWCGQEEFSGISGNSGIYT